MKLMHALPLLTYSSFQSVHQTYSDFHHHSMDHMYAKVRMSILLATMLHFVNYH